MRSFSQGRKRGLTGKSGLSRSARPIKSVIEGIQTSDGAGVKLKRVIGSPELDILDPFLLLDEFKNDDPEDYIGGFPSHPHRGFETVTYMLHGNFRHKDSVGNEGYDILSSVGTTRRSSNYSTYVGSPISLLGWIKSTDLTAILCHD